MSNDKKIAHSYDSIVNYLSINDGHAFNNLLKERRHWHFYQKLVSSPEKSYFEIDIDNLIWPKSYEYFPHFNEENEEWLEFFIKIDLPSVVCEYNDRGITYSRKNIQFSITIHAKIFSGESFMDFRNISLLSGEHETLLKYNKLYLDEIAQLDIKLIGDDTFDGLEATTFFREIWKSNNLVLDEYKKHTELYFFFELVECHRNIMFSTGSINMWGRYSSHFKDDSYLYNGGVVYPVTLSQVDYRHLFFIENAIEEIYTYYEKIAFLIYIHLGSLKTIKSINNLSFYKLFTDKTILEIITRYDQLKSCKHFRWFEKRAKSTHQALQNYRHPLVHYQHDKEIRGSYAASLTRRWLKAATDHDMLDAIFQEIDEIVAFINKELKDCKLGFKNAVLLITKLSE